MLVKCPSCVVRPLTPMLLLEDFNAHSPIWDYSTAMKAGSKREELLFTNELVFWNTGDLSLIHICM